MSPDLIHPSPPTQLVSSSVQTTPLTKKSFSHLESANQRVELSFIVMAARFVWTFNLMNCLKGGMDYTLLQAQETNRYQGFLLPLIIPNACMVSMAIVIAAIFQMWYTSVSSFMNKAFQLASNTFYSTLGIITPVFTVFCRAFMCLPSSRRANLCALVAWLIVLIATLNPAEGSALPTTCPAACLTSRDHYCKVVFRKDTCRQCRVTCNNPTNWKECEENCKGSQFYPVEATTAGEPFVATPSVTPYASTTSSPVSNTVGGSTGFERGSEYYPVDATTGEVSTAAPSVAPTVANSLWQVRLFLSVPVWCWIILGVAVVIIVVVIIIWKKKGGCTGSPGVTGDTRVTVSYEAVDSKVTATYVRENNSTGPVQPWEESNQAEALKYQTAHKKNSTVPVQPSEESNQADGKAISNGAKGRGTAKPDGRNGPRNAEAADSETTTYMVVPPDPMKTEMHIVDPDRSGE